ncbi:hypothetical protein CCGE531_32330 (plasmid) [Rhizobium sp. CCGE531]|nr:hypothetical protein CCGE531_32330 [Rhizobium sp. CCGE531]
MRWGSVGGYSFLIRSTMRKADWSGKFRAVLAATLTTVVGLAAMINLFSGNITGANRDAQRDLVGSALLNGLSQGFPAH